MAYPAYGDMAQIIVIYSRINERISMKREREREVVRDLVEMPSFFVKHFGKPKLSVVLHNSPHNSVYGTDREIMQTSVRLPPPPLSFPLLYAANHLKLSAYKLCQKFGNFHNNRVESSRVAHKSFA